MFTRENVPDSCCLSDVVGCGLGILNLNRHQVFFILFFDQVFSFFFGCPQPQSRHQVFLFSSYLNFGFARSTFFTLTIESLQSFYISWLKIVSGFHEGPHSWMSWGSWISGQIFQTKNKYIYTLTEIHTFSEASSIACFSVVGEQLGRGWTHIHCCSYSGSCHSPFLFCPSMHLHPSYLLFSSKLLL